MLKHCLCETGFRNLYLYIKPFISIKKRKHSKENGQWTKGQFLFSWIEVLGCFHMLSPLIKYPIFNNVPLKACQIVWLKHIIVALINEIVCSCISKVAKECIVICPKNNRPYINNHFTIAFVFASLLIKDKYRN